MKGRYQILKFYCYTRIENPEETGREHDGYGRKRGLRGRIKVAEEGLNGTISGRYGDCQSYIGYLKSDSRLGNMTLNVTEGDGHVHQKWQVKVKREIVHAGLPEMMPSMAMEERCYITPKVFERIRLRPDVEILDVRSNYEHGLGTFEGARTFDIDNFREFPGRVDGMELDAGKKYVVVCTSGIKCEKARDYLREKKNLRVWHLRGGIIGYGQETDGSGFRGVCYVFDERLTVGINRKNPSIISRCEHCKRLSYRMINCANVMCNRHVPMCEVCSDELEGACCVGCQVGSGEGGCDGSGCCTKRGDGYNGDVACGRSGK